MINYPVSWEQVRILAFGGIEGTAGLWLIRLVCVGLMAGMMVIWLKMSGRLAVAVMISLPIWWVIIWIYPWWCLKFAVVTLWLVLVNKNNWWKWGWVVAAVFLLVANNGGANRAAILSKFDLSANQAAVTKRFVEEDSLRERIEMPLVWRRLAYNKYFFVYRGVMSEILPFFDLESWFFEEVEPMEQKSVVIFYWPLIIPFLVGIYKISKKRPKPILLTTLVVAMANFVFSWGDLFLRFMWLVPALSMIIAEGLKHWQDLAKKDWLLAKVGLMVVLIGWTYGIGINWYDLNSRTDYWLDNRPIAYDFMLKAIDPSGRAMVTNLIGPTQDYCSFYGVECLDFDMEKIEPGMVVAGFEGEFLGSRFKNDFDKQGLERIEAMGFKIIKSTELRDTIAYRYGNKLVVAIYE